MHTRKGQATNDHPAINCGILRTHTGKGVIHFDQMEWTVLDDLQGNKDPREPYLSSRTKSFLE